MRKPRYYSFMGSKPLKTPKKVIAAIRHDTRSRKVKNANTDMSDNNGWLIRSHSDDLEKKFTDIIKGIKKIRKNARYAKMFVFSASPEFFRPLTPWAYGVYDPELTKRFEEYVKEWAIKKFGKNILYMVSHLDEATPHIHCVFIPLTDDNELNYESFFGGDSSVMIRLQDDFAAHVAVLGLKRGRRFSAARHQDVGVYYTNVNRALEPLPELPVKPQHPGPEPETNLLFNAQRDLKRKYKEALATYAEAMITYKEKIFEAYKKGYEISLQHQQKANHCEFLQDNYDLLLDKLERVEHYHHEAKKDLYKHSTTKLDELMESYFGFEQAPESMPDDGVKVYLYSENKRMDVYPKANHWQYSTGRKSGKGAVSLLAELLDPASMDSKTAQNKALNFLTINYGRERAVNDYAFHLVNKSEKVVNQLPIPKPRDPSDFNCAIKLLEEQYHIPIDQIIKLRDTQKLSVDFTGNLIFPFEGGNGYFSRSSDDSKDSPKARFSRVTPLASTGLYRLNPNKPTVVLVENPMDVLAVNAIDPETEVIVFYKPSKKVIEETLNHAVKVVWGIEIESDPISGFKALVTELCLSKSVPFVTETRLTNDPRSRTWHRLLKNNPNLLNAGVIRPIIPPPEPKAPTPLLRPRYPRPKGF